MHRKLGQKKAGENSTYGGPIYSAEGWPIFMLHSNVYSTWKGCTILSDGSVDQPREWMNKSAGKKEEICLNPLPSDKGISKKRS